MTATATFPGFPDAATRLWVAAEATVEKLVLKKNYRKQKRNS